jgi:phosphoglycolate phosphatase-like HAD superfamily hydrolase
MRPTILLFDLDGTLVSTGGAGRRAIERAFNVLYAERGGAREACGHFSFAGMTDRAIARGGLEALGIAPTEEEIARVLACYVERLDDELAPAKAPGFRVLAGVRDVLDRAGARRDVAIGLGTGNVVAGARKKLTVCGLWERFPFGGFADDSEDRAELILAGARRGAERLAQPLAKCRVVVIGDTPRDVAAAEANRFESLAVATGQHPLEELAATRATLAVKDLSDARAIDALFGA